MPLKAVQSSLPQFWLPVDGSVRMPFVASRLVAALAIFEAWVSSVVFPGRLGELGQAVHDDALVVRPCLGVVIVLAVGQVEAVVDEVL